MSESSRGDRFSLAAGLIAFLWIGAVVALYYFWHKPLSFATAAALGRAFWQLTIGVGILSISGGLGQLILRARADSTPARASLEAAIGLGILSLGFLLVGALHGFQRWLFFVVWALGLILLVKPARSWWRALLSLGRGWMRSEAQTRVLTFLIIGTTILTLPVAIAPPLKFDALVYHLTLPETYLSEGGIDYLPWLSFWGMPQIAEMLFTWATALGGAPAAATFGWLVGLLVLAGTVGLLKGLVGERSAWIGAASLLAGFSAASSLAWAYVGWISMLFGLAMLEALRRWLTDHALASAALVGMCAGFALGVKYTAGVLLPAGFLAMFFAPAIAQRARVRGALAFLATSILSFAPWMVKNAIGTGNPFYPLLYASGSMSPLRIALFQNQPAWGNVLDALILPLRATFLGAESAPGFSFASGPLLLAFAVFAAFYPQQDGRDLTSKVRFQTAIMVLAALVIWAVAGRLSGLLIQTRLYLAAFPAVAILAGIGYRALELRSTRQLRLGWLAAGVTVLVLGLNSLAVARQTISSAAVPVVFGLQAPQSYVENNLGWYGLVARELRDMQDAKVLMLWEPRSFYCRPVCEPDEIIDRWLRDIRTFGDGTSVLRAWQDMGLTHVLVNWGGMSFTRESDRRYRQEEWAALDDLLGEMPLEKDYDGVYRLYGLRP